MDTFCDGGGFTLINSLPQFLKTVRDEQVKYSYELIRGWHSIVAECNKGSALFSTSKSEYINDEISFADKKKIRDNFQRLLDHMSLILFSITFERTQDPDELKRVWEKSFELQFSEAELAHYLWETCEFRKTIVDDLREFYDKIFDKN